VAGFIRRREVSEHFPKSLYQLPAATLGAVTGLRRGLVEIFCGDLAAIWLYGGSLFSPIALDIDLYIWLARPPSAHERQKIRQMHVTISSNERGVDEFDAWYILLDDARRTGAAAKPWPLAPGPA
jgi:hypothetical protein